MADNFGLKIGIEGEKEFKKALSEINQSFKVLGSEMKLVSSQFDSNDKSIQALSARNTVLNKEIDAQRQKIETLRAALQNASESFGENDRRTQNWQIQLNNAEAALNGMERELSANERAIESLSRQETEAADATERLSQEISRQEEELSGMKRAYSNAVLEYGKGSSEAKELEGRISQLSGELRENRERMKDAGDVAEDFGDSLEDASSGADKLRKSLNGVRAAAALPFGTGQLLQQFDTEQPRLGICGRICRQWNNRNQSRSPRRVQSDDCRLRSRKNRHCSDKEHFPFRAQYR